ncbi:tetratricopeptide repeat protein [Brevibacillus dissolubilis]|uniref:tetratricopeptide repeat protein n=1 Tax=Brevibacillus dissolubilis TaxID=1844116 RepID=UPI001116B145|nr:tetratricopeptide repeat protein [Brevibacillus dissolubilis]
MLMDKWFLALHEKLKTIEQAWPKATMDEKEQLARQLLALRQTSDQMIDLWLQYEEKLSSVIKDVKAQHTGQTTLPTNAQTVLQGLSALGEDAFSGMDDDEDWDEDEVGVEEDVLHMQTGGQQKAATSESSTKQKQTYYETFDVPLKGKPNFFNGDESGAKIHAGVSDSSADADGNTEEHKLKRNHALFRKGEGFYHLRLFQEAKTHLADLVEQAPDWESGRMYYAYSLLHCGEKEAALREFRLLSHTASSPKITSLSLNAVGCILAEEGHWLEASQAFGTALEVVAGYKEARYNLALCYIELGEAQEALEHIAAYLKKEPDDSDAQLVWIRALQCLSHYPQSEVPAPPSSLKEPSDKHETAVLVEMAALYVEAGNFKRAKQCYQLLCERHPAEGFVWHGLAWVTWLSAGYQRAMPILLKALTLQPNHPDYLFSYAWMELYHGQVEEARRILQAILFQDRDHLLAQAGLITLYEYEGAHTEAKRLAQSMVAQEDVYTRSLGYLSLGRIAMAETHWRIAEQYFAKVDGHSGLAHEAQEYASLCQKLREEAHLGAKETITEHPHART